MFMCVSISVWCIYTEFDKVRKAFLAALQTTKLYGQTASLAVTPCHPTAVQYSHRHLPSSLRFSVHPVTLYLSHPPVIRRKLSRKKRPTFSFGTTIKFLGSKLITSAYYTFRPLLITPSKNRQMVDVVMDTWYRATVSWISLLAHVCNTRGCVSFTVVLQSVVLSLFFSSVNVDLSSCLCRRYHRFAVCYLTEGGIADMLVEPMLKATTRPQNTARRHVMRLRSSDR